jgi:hypothetical protein
LGIREDFEQSLQADNLVCHGLCFRLRLAQTTPASDYRLRVCSADAALMRCAKEEKKENRVNHAISFYSA